MTLPSKQQAQKSAPLIYRSKKCWLKAPVFVLVCFKAQNTNNRLEVSWDQVDSPHPEQTSQGHIVTLVCVEV